MSEELMAAVEAEKAELLAERQKYQADQLRAAERIAQVDRELHALDVWEDARTGKPAPNGHDVESRHPRRSGVRADVLDVIERRVKETGLGVTRGDILEAMGLHGDKSGEMSVSNALTALLKRRRVVRENGRYIPAHDATVLRQA